jgi:hypothetical protein
MVMIPERCAEKRIQWANKQGLEFDSIMAEVALFMCRGGHKKHLQLKLPAYI